MELDQDMMEAEEVELDEGSHPTTSVSSGETNQMECSPGNNSNRRFLVRKWTAIALWSYDISVDNCAICRNHIMDKCIECQSVQEITNIDESCNIAWGKCSHVFHMHCISKWLNTRQVCPLDNRNWEFKKYGA